jgi:hypothetical protein
VEDLAEGQSIQPLLTNYVKQYQDLLEDKPGASEPDLNLLNAKLNKVFY